MSLHYATQYEGDYLEALMLPTDKPVEVEIEEVIAAGTLKAKDGRVIDKPVLRFKDRDRSLILCKTNARGIARRLGPDMSAWKSKTIGLYQARIDAFGEKDVPAVRVWGAPMSKKRR